MEISHILSLLEIYFAKYGYLTIFLGSFIEITPMGWTIPGGLLLAMAGFFANGKSSINIVLVVIFGTLGAWSTFILAYILGHKSGLWLVKKLHQEKNASLAKHILNKHGGPILTTSMMSNLIRFWVAYFAGVQRYNIFKFLLYSFAASFGWVSIMTFVGFLAGFQKGSIEKVAGTSGIVSWIVLIIVFGVFYQFAYKEFKRFKEDAPNEEI